MSKKKREQINKFSEWNSDLNKRVKGQQQWLQSTLSSSNTSWLFVAGHYPVFSGGPHGDTPELIEGLLPLLIENDVDAYLCGHDHSLQHLQSGGVEFFLSGSAAKTSSVEYIRQTTFASSEYGFSLHEIDSKSLTTTFIDYKGDKIYSYTQKRRRN